LWWLSSTAGYESRQRGLKNPKAFQATFSTSFGGSFPKERRLFLSRRPWENFSTFPWLKPFGFDARRQ